MLPIDYQILRLFATLQRWTPRIVGDALGTSTARARVRLSALLRQEYVSFYRGEYEITEAGRQVLAGARANPVLRNPYPWINRVRAGVDTDGHELNLRGRAVIPSSEPADTSYEMDIDWYIDAKRAGLLDELLND